MAAAAIHPVLAAVARIEMRKRRERGRERKGTKKRRQFFPPALWHFRIAHLSLPLILSSEAE